MRQRHMILMVSCCRICSSTGASSDHSDDVGSMQSGTRGLVWVVKSDTGTFALAKLEELVLAAEYNGADILA